jgi:hypothetical protein
MIQGGCPLGNGTGGPGYAIPDEFNANLTHHSAGILSMANSGPDSGGSQFFITLENTSWLDGKHAVFGEVIDGMNTVSNIGAVATDTNDRPLVDVEINHIQILRVGDVAQDFDPQSQPIPEVVGKNLLLTHEGAGMAVGSSTSNQWEIQIFSSLDLANWAPSGEKYFPVKTEDWMQTTSINLPTEFFRGTRVFYPQAVTNFSDVSDHTLSFTNETDQFVFVPAADGGGECTISGTQDMLSFWAEWTSEPYLGRIVFDPESYVPFQFLLSPSGVCNGYYWSNGVWNSMGSFVFTDTPPAE